MPSTLPEQVASLPYKFPIWPVTSDGACSCSMENCGGDAPRPGKHARVRWMSFEPGWQPAEGENYGIRTGAVNGVFVVDCDGESAAAHFVDALDDDGVPIGFSVTTGREDGGAHFYFRQPPGVRVKTGKDVLGPGIDVRGDGGMVVGPGSIHRTGARYAVSDDAPIPDAPEWLLEGVVDTRDRETGEHIEPIAADDPYRPARLEAFEEKCRTWEPDRSNNLFVLAQHGVRLYELDDDAVKEAIVRLYNPRCTPLWEDGQIDHKIAEARDDGWVPVGVGERFRAAVSAAIEADTPVARINREVVATIGKRMAGHQPKINLFDSDDDTMIVKWLNGLYADEDIVSAEGHWWQYDAARGVWIDCGARVHEDLMHLHACSYMDAKKEVRPIKVAANRLKGIRELLAFDGEKKAFFDEATPGFACRSGFVTVTTGGEVEVRPHDKDFRCRAFHDIDFDLDAPCPKLDAFLNSLFLNDLDAEQKKSLLAEYFGVSLFGCATQFQKALLFSGEGSNGKSAAMQLLQEMFPIEGTCSIHPKHFADPPQLARLPGKILNVVFELGKSRILEADTLKNVIVGDQISACEKYKPPFDFRPIAGNVYGVNALPATNDLSHGFFRRFLIVTFNRTFDATTADPHVLDGVREERAGILAWLVRGAARALASKGFTTPGSHHEELRDWKRDGDPVALFLEQMTDRTKEGAITTSNKLWDAYVGWCDRFGYKSGTTTAFGKRLTALKVARRRAAAGAAYEIALLQVRD